MTETLVNAEAQPVDLGALLTQWGENPPPSLSAALAESGVDIEALESYARSGITTEEVEALRKLLVQGAAAGNGEDATLLARLTPVLDPRERAWDRVLRAKSTGEVLTATVTEAVRGGVVVDLGVRGFVPSSQIGLNVPRNLGQFVGRPLRLRVLEVDRKRQTVILTNRQIMEEERAEKRKSAITRLEEGEERSGTVRRLTDIGAFVDVGGVDGLLHVSEISWKRVERPSDELTVGQKIQVKVLRVDPSAGRISLSMRRLAPDPWEEARRKYSIGQNMTVKVARTIPEGAIVTLEEGIEGFIPISELANRRVATAEEVVQPEQEVEALVIDLVPRDRRIIFSLKKLEQKKERQVVDNYQKKTRSTSERTTLGDLFGHLFKEFADEEEKPAEQPAAADASSAAGTDAEPRPAHEAALGPIADDASSGTEAVAPEDAITGEEAVTEEELHTAEEAWGGDGAAEGGIGADEAPAAEEAVDESGATAGAATDPDPEAPAAESPMDVVDDWGATGETPPGAVDAPSEASDTADASGDASGSEGMDAPSDAVNSEQNAPGSGSGGTS